MIKVYFTHFLVTINGRYTRIRTYIAQVHFSATKLQAFNNYAN